MWFCNRFIDTYTNTSMGFLSRALTKLGQEVKANVKVPFSIYGSLGQGDAGMGYTSSRDIGYLFTTNPGAQYDYLTAAGNLAENSVVAAASEAIARALPDAPPILEVKNKKGKWESAGDHEVLDFLGWPNGAPDKDVRGYSAAHLWAATIRSEYTNGNGFWRLVVARDGTPLEAWWEPFMSPRYNKTEFIQDYVIYVDGKPYYLPVEQVVHFRLALNPYNSRWGYTPLYTAVRHVDGDNRAATFHTALLRNGAVGSYSVSLNDSADYAKAGITPKQFDATLAKWEKRLRGEGAGRMISSSLPVKIDKLDYSPNDLMLDKLVAYYESRICAVLGIPAMVIGISSGDSTKTYSNYEEALKDFWQRTIKPLNGLHASELGAQLLPLFGLSPSEYRINWDYSNVAALQESVDAVHTRARANWQADGITLNEFRGHIGEETKPEFEDVWYTNQGPKEISSFDPNDPSNQPLNPAQAISGAPSPEDGPTTQTDEEQLAALDKGATKSADDEPRDEHGRWTSEGDDSTASTEVIAPRPDTNQPTSKSELSKLNHKVSTREKQQYAEQNEVELAKHLGGYSLEDNEPPDIIVPNKSGKGHQPIELKTMLDNDRDRITIHADSLERKQKYAADNKTTFHTVVLDHRDRFAGGVNAHQHSGHEIYYRRGLGSYKLSAMYKVKDHAELNRLIHMSNSKLPLGARP